MKLLLATNNKGKKREAIEILSPLGIDIVTPSDLGIVFEAEETGTTFAENAMIKARRGFELSGLGTVADDSGLCVEALGGRPGVYSARYGSEDMSYPEKIKLLLAELAPYKDRRACFECAVACVLPDGNCFTVSGRCDGIIADCPNGDGGFGYDPIFFVPQIGKTFSGMTEDEKNAISHRGAAMRALCRRIEEIQGKNV